MTESEEISSELASEIASLLAENPNDYQLVRSEKASDVEVKILLSFRQSLSKLTSYDVKIVTDDARIYPEKVTEIIVGLTERSGSDASPSVDAYRIGVVDKKIYLAYGSRAELKNALESLLVEICYAKSAKEVKNTFASALQDKNINRFDAFKLQTYLADGMKLMGDTIVFGIAPQKSTVSVLQYDGEDLLCQTDATVDIAGNWQAQMSPRENVNRLEIVCNGVTVLQYRNISYVTATATASTVGMKVYIDGIEQKTFRSSAGNLIVASCGSVEQKSMEIVIKHTHQSVKIRPLNENQDYISDGKEVKITVDEFPKKLSVEFDGSYSDSVQLFLYAHDTADVTALGANTLYFPAGEYTIAEELKLTSGQIIYLAQGARLHARLSAENVSNITIMGYGVIDTFPFDVDTNMLTFVNCKNVTLKDFSLIGPRKWMIKFENSSECIVQNMNIVGTEMNSDGVDIVGSKNVTVTGCYLKNNDDCIAIKSYEGMDVEHIRVIGNILFNDVYGNALEIGFETRGDKITDIVFEDNDIIHILGGSLFSIHLGDHATVSDIHYRNIRVEDCYKKFVEIYIRESQYSKDTERGQIRDVTFENISLVGIDLGTISIGGFDDLHTTENITFKNITKDGIAISASDVTILDKTYTKNVIWDGQILVP